MITTVSRWLSEGPSMILILLVVFTSFLSSKCPPRPPIWFSNITGGHNQVSICPQALVWASAFSCTCGRTL